MRGRNRISWSVRVSFVVATSFQLLVLVRVTRIPIIASINFYATPDKPSRWLVEQTSALIVTASARLRVRPVRLLLSCARNNKIVPRRLLVTSLPALFSASFLVTSRREKSNNEIIFLYYFTNFNNTCDERTRFPASWKYAPL